MLCINPRIWLNHVLLVVCLIKSSDATSPRGWRAAIEADSGSEIWNRYSTSGDTSHNSVWIVFAFLGAAAAGFVLGILVGKRTPSQQSKETISVLCVPEKEIKPKDELSTIESKDAEKEEIEEVTSQPAASTSMLRNALDSDAGTSSSSLNTEAVKDIQAAGTIVGQLCKELHLDLSQASNSDKLQALHIVLKTWHTMQSKQHGERVFELGSKANEIQSKRKDIEESVAKDQTAMNVYVLTQERARALRATAFDVLMCGMAVMYSVGAHQMYTKRRLYHSFWSILDKECPVLGNWSGWGVWMGWRAMSVVYCWMATAADVTSGLALLLTLPWVAYKSGLFSSDKSSTFPFTRLGFGLGGVGGTIGCYILNRVGGSAVRWLFLWELWILCHTYIISSAYSMIAPSCNQNLEDVLYQQGSSYVSARWLRGLAWLALGFVLPALCAYAPFI